jgi:hypothetical protein
MSNQDSLVITPQADANFAQEQSGLYTTQISLNVDYYNKSRHLLELLREIGAVELNTNGELVVSSFLFTNDNPKKIVPRILGYVAEGIVVRECNQKLSKNQQWANHARMLRRSPNPVVQFLESIFYEPFLDNPDNYIAVGTGFTKTKFYYNHIYNPQSDRDICWIDQYHNAKELLTVQGIKKNKRRVAGIQLKVSLGTNGNYVTNYFKRKKYYTLYPVVYFDLGNDFHKVKDNLLYLDSDTVGPDTLFASNVQVNHGVSREQIIDMMLIRGKDIAPELHEELLYYRHVLQKIVSGKINLVDLNNTEILTSLIVEYSSYILNPSSPILNVAV